ncbi:uncharacterized protein LOC143028521 [Oratosquilla oratoria]|uniref:uncharacterized protein LOC143028521 n=1 Tax=Oratosquilla oratoria TaxID=337810 RepID=UPI003F761B8E
MVFAHDAALTAYTEEALQRLINCFAHACKELALTISIKKTNVMGQDVSSIPSICIDGHILEVVCEFTFLGSTISSNLFLDAELNKRIGKAATALAPLGKRVWDNAMLTTNTKIAVYQACALSTLLCGSEVWFLPAGRPILRYKEVLKRDLKAGDINPASWEAVAANRSRVPNAPRRHYDVTPYIYQEFPCLSLGTCQLATV